MSAAVEHGGEFVDVAVEFEYEGFGFQVAATQDHVSEGRVEQLDIDLAAVELGHVGAGRDVVALAYLQRSAAPEFQGHAVDLKFSAADHIAIAQLLDAFGHKRRVAEFESRNAFAFAPVGEMDR